MSSDLNMSAVVAVHQDEQVLQSTLMRSPALKEARGVLCQRGYATVAAAYNAALRECGEEFLLFVHPDVYLPRPWAGALRRSLEWLEEHDPEWAVLGLWGVTGTGSRCGYVYSTGLGGYIGAPSPHPREVRTVDEFAFVLRKASGLGFDELLPSAQLQLGATDLCLEAARRGLRCYASSCFTIHNSNGWSYLPLNFWRCYLYVRRKWRRELPVQAPYARITASCLPLVRETVSGWLRGGQGRHRRVTRVADPEALYETLRGEVMRAFQ